MNRVVRIVIQIALDELSVSKCAAVVGDSGRLLIVGDEHHTSSALMSDRAQQLDDFPASRAIEVPGRLVREDQARLPSERASNGDALALASRELLGCAIEAVAKTDPLEPRNGESSSLSQPDAADNQLAGSVLDGGDSWHQVKALEDEPDLAQQVLACLALRHRGHLVSPITDHPLIRLEQGRDQQQQGCLARAAGPKQRHHLARCDGEAHAVDGAYVLSCAVVVLYDPFELEQRCSPRPATVSSPVDDG